MIKGLAITPPVLGRISIGRVIEKNGKRLPEKDDQFTITTQVQTKDGWILHPLDEQLRKDAPNGKLRSIPVRMLFNDPDLNLRAEYSLFDRQQRTPALCRQWGNLSPLHPERQREYIALPVSGCLRDGTRGACKPYGRLNVKLSVKTMNWGRSSSGRRALTASVYVAARHDAISSAVSGNRLPISRWSSSCEARARPKAIERRSTTWT
jgi:hypothetical protein